jgi:hypothetical protein
MPKDKTILIKEYLQKVEAANKELTKKEAFKDLLNRLYAAMLKRKASLIKSLWVLKKQMSIFPGSIVCIKEVLILYIMRCHRI